MKAFSRPAIAVLSLGILLGACTNGGKNVRDTTGMSPGSAAGQVGGAGGTASATPPATADSITSRRDTLGGRMSRMRSGMSPMMRDSARRRP